MIKHIKKGLFMVGILAAVLSLAGCPKEAGSSGGGEGNNFNIASVEGTWIYSGTNSNESVVITSNTITITKYNTSLSSIAFSGAIVKTLTKGNYVAIIGKNIEGKYKGYYLKNINTNTSIDVGRWNGDNLRDSLEEAENEFLN
ncbi:MAG: hypothetical protein K6E97_07115, partial [Treponema sp.]|nr:hypothetical protein [Treponema sp.]